jgi:hypothetical protein
VDSHKMVSNIEENIIYDLTPFAYSLGLLMDVSTQSRVKTNSDFLALDGFENLHSWNVVEIINVQGLASLRAFPDPADQ